LFFGRTLLVPEINIEVNGGEEYVPVGTTLRHIVERAYTGISRPRRLKFRRWIDEQKANIRFENATIGFDLFLVPGDTISW
jgi:hypothetical protein